MRVDVILTGLLPSTFISAKKLKRQTESAARVATYKPDNVFMKIPSPPIDVKQRRRVHAARVKAEMQAIGFLT